MALGENQNKIQYTVTTSDATFDFPYKYWDETELVVTKLDAGVETNPSFTVAPTNGDPQNGATVTLDVAIENSTLTIERIITLESEANYQVGAFSPSGLTEQFDKGVAISQQQEERLSRISAHPTSDPAGLNYDIPTVINRAGKAEGWDALGNKVALALADEGGAFTAVSESAGLTASGGTISAKVDEVTTTFTGGDIAVKALGIGTAQLAAGAVDTSKLASTTGVDANVVTGTAGAVNTYAKWDANGDAIAGPLVADVATVALVTTEVGDFAQMTEFISSNQSIPSTDTDLEIAHSLGAVPRWFRVVLKCTTTDLGYAVGDEVDKWRFGGTEASGTWASATNVGFRTSSSNIDIVPRTGTSTVSSITKSSWRLVFKAWK